MKYEIGDKVKLDPNGPSYEYVVKEEGLIPDKQYIISARDIIDNKIHYRIDGVFLHYWYDEETFLPYDDVEETRIDWLAINRDFA